MVEQCLRVRNNFSKQPERRVSVSLLDIYKSKVGFVFHISNTQELEIIRSFSKKTLSKYNNPITIIISDLQKDIMVPSESEILISLNDFNLFGSFSKDKKDTIIKHGFQLMFSFVSKSSIFNDNIINHIESGFKAGPYMVENFNSYDLTIKHNSVDFNDQLKQFEYYLNNLNLVT